MHAVLFDIDGTLIESAVPDDILYQRAVTDILGPVAIRNPISKYKHVSDSGIVAEIFADNSIEKCSQKCASIRERFVELLQDYIDANGPFPEIRGARGFIEALLSSEHHAVAFATGGWRQSALLKLETSGLMYSEVPLASSSEAQSREEIMILALAEIGDAFESITYFGDGEWDRDASLALGWDFRAVGAKLGGIESFDGQAMPGENLNKI